MPEKLTARIINRYELPGQEVFPESIGVDPVTGDAYVGSLADGTLYRLGAAGQAEVWSGAGYEGRVSVAVVKVDSRQRLWAAGGYDGTLWVHDVASGGLLARLDAGSRPSCVNDIAFTADGSAYVTDSFIPVVFRAGGDPPAMDPWADLSTAGVPWPDGLNFNGIVVTPDSAHLVACQTNLGRFWRLELASGKVHEVALAGGPLEHCDGLAIAGSRLYVALNALDTIAVADLAADGGSGEVTALLTSAEFAFPTAVAVRGDQLLVVNGQLDKMSTSPRLPFSVVAADLPRSLT